MTTTADAQAGRMDLAAYIRTWFRHKWMIIGIVFVVTALSVVLALILTPIYRSEVMITPVRAQGAPADLMNGLGGGLGALAGLAGLGNTGGAAKEEALATLQSRIFTNAFIEKHDLIKVLFHDKWNADTGEWEVDNPKMIPDIDDAFEKFDRKIRSVSVDKRTGMITVRIEWEDRIAAAEWANDLVASVNLKLRDRARQEANTSIQFLEEELEKTSVMELRQAIFSLVENQIQLRMMANVRKEYAFKVIDPAVPAAADKEVFPKRALMVLSAFSVSLFFSMALALVLEGLRSTPNES